MNRILIVDDNEHITRMLDEVLTSQGYIVEVATTGKEAMHLIDNHHFNIAFVDIGLDDTSGLNVLCYIKNKSPETVSTVISGGSNIDNAIDSIKIGAFRYLKKPFNIDSLDEVIEQSMIEYEKRTAIKKRDDDSRQTKMFIKMLCDIALLLPVMFLGFLVQKEIYYYRELPIFWGTREMIYIISSFAFCYAFIFTSDYGRALREKSWKITEILKAYGSAYILFAGILFFVTDFIYGRLVLLSSFAMGLPVIWFNRKVMWRKIDSLFGMTIEGPKSLTLKNAQQAGDMDETTVITDIPADLDADSTELKKSVDSQILTESVKISESELGSDWGSRLIREFRNNRLKRAGKPDKVRKLEKVK